MMTHRFHMPAAFFAFFFAPVFLAAQTVTTQSLGQTTYCVGQEVSVDFTVTGAFNAGNAMILQLSDPGGSFSSGFRNLASLSTTVSGSIQAVLPGDLPSGTGYRVRVIASNPRVDGSDNGTDLVIETLPNIKARIVQGAMWMMDQNFTVTDLPIVWQNETKNAASYWWNMGIGVGATPEQTGEASPTVTYSTPGEKAVRFLAYTAGGCEVRQDYRVTVLASSPVIPADAIIIRNDTNLEYVSKGAHYWICPGGTARFRGEVGDCFVYVEGGGSLVAKYFTQAMIFAKSGAACNSTHNEAWFFYEEGASITSAESRDYAALTKVPSLTFDYSKVPPGGCPSLAPYTVQIKPNTNSIHSAQEQTGSDAEYWVRDGGALRSTGNGNAYYVEAGGHVVIDGSENRVYLQDGATADVRSGSGNRIFYEPQGVIVNAGLDPILLPSSGITFVAEVSGVREESPATGGELIALSPNPAEDEVEVRLDPALGSLRRITLFDMLGKTVFQTEGIAGSTERLSLGDVAPGVYHLRIRTDRTELVRKLVVR